MHSPAPTAEPRTSTRTTLLYGVTIFSSAFLLFQVQPMIAKMILPWFGGAAAVWTVCLLFFQSVLLLGYLYAHLLIGRVAPRRQGRVHAALLAVSLVALPIVPREAWKPTGAQDPTARILLLLLVTVGLPYFLLSATSPLLQAWYARARANAAPYRFYALSNVGSFLALLTYPVVIEPAIATHRQAIGWSVAYGGFAVLCGAVSLTARAAAIATEEDVAAARPRWTTQLLWLSLAACGSALLLAITNHISQNIAAVPFLWVVPLSLYLLTFILCFEGKSWYRREIFVRLLGVALGAMAYALAGQFSSLPLRLMIALFCAGLFVCCMFCHGELARLKPHPSHLTSFYLMVSLGGALGAAFVALLAPHAFSGLYELPIAIAACAVLALVVLHRDPESSFYRAGWNLQWLALVGLVLALGVNLFLSARKVGEGARVMERNFYGVLRVADHASYMLLEGFKLPDTELPDIRFRELMNGTINHGIQLLAPSRRREPTTYYSHLSGIGITLDALAARGPLRVGVIGLGAGTIAAYGRAGDRYTFYEINPLVIQIARNEFTFLRDSPAETDIVAGDARLSLEREPPQNFDVLAVDAFSGDSIPVHLLTREALALYFRHLKPGGVLAVHVSNKYLALEPVVAGGADWLHKNAVTISNDTDEKKGINASTWVLVSAQQNFFSQPTVAVNGETIQHGNPRVTWTDDYSSLFRVLK